MSLPLPPRPDLEPLAPPDGVEPGRTATWPWWEVALVTLAGFLIGVIAATPLYLWLKPDTSGAVDGPGLLISAFVDLVLAGVLLLWLRGRHPGWSRIVGWPAPGRRLREVAVGVGFGLLLEVVTVVASVVVAIFLHEVTGQQVEDTVQITPGLHGWSVVILVAMAIVVAPVVEEFVFRGLLFRSLADRYGFWVGAIASAVPFGLTHAGVGTAVDLWALRITLTVVGVLLAWVHWRRRNLLANIAAHATFNVIGVVVVLAMIRS